MSFCGSMFGKIYFFRFRRHSLHTFRRANYYYFLPGSILQSPHPTSTISHGPSLSSTKCIYMARFWCPDRKLEVRCASSQYSYPYLLEEALRFFIVINLIKD